MTRVGQAAGGSGGSGPAASDLDVADRRAADLEAAPGQAGLGERRPKDRDGDLADRAALFESRMRAVARADEAAAAEAAQLRVLAAVELPAHILPVAAPPAGAPAEPLAPRLQALVASLAAQAEEAIRMQMAALPGQPTTVRIDLRGIVEGLREVTITLTPLGIDVDLARAGGLQADELVPAAQALAERLSTRFGKRTVRVRDVVDDAGGLAAEQPPAGLAAFGVLLGRRTDEP